MMVCVISYTTYCTGEIFETLALCHWIYSQRTAESHMPISFSSDEDDKEIVSGLTASYKVFLYLFIIIPKFAIGVLLVFYGNTFLLTSDSNQDIILNSMALTFITQNDEVIFDSLVSENLKTVCGELPPVQISHKSKLISLYRPIFFAIVIMICVAHAWFDVCMDDDWTEL